MGTWLLYGANGYTGQLIAERAVEQGLKPILAGRRASVIAPLAERLGLEHRCFGLDDAADLKRALQGVDVVLHAAGPYSATSRPMLDGCVAVGAHYLDITGEIAVFERIFARSPELVRRGVTAIPGVGFDVVPTDTMAALLSEALPSATRLDLAFAALGGGVSPGTAKTAVEGAPYGGAARIRGRIKRVPPAWRTREVPLGGKPRTVISVPWGDVSTAWYSTGIPDITTYTAFPPSAVAWMKRTAPIAPLLAAGWIQRLLKGLVERRIQGPAPEVRSSGRSVVWGRVEDDQGRWVEGNLSCAEGYHFTAQASVAAVQALLAGGVPPGALTPTKAFGTGFFSRIEGTAIEPLRRSG